MPSRAAPLPPSSSSSSASSSPAYHPNRPLHQLGRAASDEQLGQMVAPLSVAEKRRSGGPSSQRTSYAVSSRPPFQSQQQQSPVRTTGSAHHPNKLKRPSNPPHPASAPGPIHTLNLQQQQQQATPYKSAHSPSSAAASPSAAFNTSAASGLGGAWEFVEPDAGSSSSSSRSGARPQQTPPSSAGGGLRAPQFGAGSSNSNSSTGVPRHSLLNDPNTSAAASMVAYGDAPVHHPYADPSSSASSLLQPALVTSGLPHHHQKHQQQPSPISPSEPSPMFARRDRDRSGSDPTAFGLQHSPMSPTSETPGGGGGASSSSSSKIGKRRTSDLKGSGQGGTIKGAIGNFFGGMSGQCSDLPHWTSPPSVHVTDFARDTYTHRPLVRPQAN